MTTAMKASATIDFDFRERLNRTLSGKHHNYCYQCGACVSYCPAARYVEDFNPRTIMLMALYGLAERLISPDSVIWKCTNCYTCYERCPQDVRPVDVITAIKNMCVAEDKAPDMVKKYSQTILDTGVSAPLSVSVQRKREQYGLPEVDLRGYDEMKALLAGEEQK